MPDLMFRVDGVEAVPFAASPQLAFRVRVANAIADEAIHSVSLRCQLRIEPAARHYSPAEREHLLELFDEPSRWGQTLRSMLWTHVTATVPGFTGETRIDLPVPCTFDFNVAATKYFHALESGDIAVSLLFSGTVFHEGSGGGLQVAQIPWDREARFRLPVTVWREMMDHYYPNSAWLCLRRDVFDQLHRFKLAHGLTDWEQVLDRLLPAEDPS